MGRTYLDAYNNVPHVGHVIILAIVEVIDGMVADAMSSRLGFGRRDTYLRTASVVAALGADVHTVCDIDPDEPGNITFLLAFELTQAAAQSS